MTDALRGLIAMLLEQIVEEFDAEPPPADDQPQELTEEAL